MKRKFEGLGPYAQSMKKALDVHREDRKMMADLRSALADSEKTVAELREALFQHREDLHQYSKRPCATCRNSAKALRITALVPDSCSPAWNMEERELKEVIGDTK